MTASSAALEARQHRIDRRRRDKRGRSSDDEDDDEDLEQEHQRDHDEDDSFAGGPEQELHTTTNRKIPLSSIRGIKKQARYEPVVPMSREELTEWRKEARRVRNRESAAASRRKTRDRIDELEGQVQVLETKYAKALERIAELEQIHGNPATTTTMTTSMPLPPPPPLAVPSLVNTTPIMTTENQAPLMAPRTVSPNISSTAPCSMKSVILPNWSLGHDEVAPLTLLTNKNSSALDFSKAALLPSSSLTENHPHYYHHLHHNPLMFSRPTAA